MSEYTPETLRGEAAEIRLNEQRVVQPSRFMLALADRLGAHASAWEAAILAEENGGLHKRIEALERLHADVRALVASWEGISETTLEDCVVSDLAALAQEKPG